MLKSLENIRRLAPVSLARARRPDFIEIRNYNVDLNPSPIDPSWIVDGNPEAHSCELWTSACGTFTTLIWSCTEGRFNWYYDVDETIVILEGSMVLEGKGTSTRYGAGDVIFFRRGARARWHVDSHVKKIAFLRLAMPFGFGLAIRVINRFRAMSVFAAWRTPEIES